MENAPKNSDELKSIKNVKKRNTITQDVPTKKRISTNTNKYKCVTIEVKEWVGAEAIMENEKYKSIN